MRLHLWKFVMRLLSHDPAQRGEFIKYVAINAATEGDAVKHLKTHHFTSTWWETTLILQVIDLDELWYLEKR